MEPDELLDDSLFEQLMAEATAPMALRLRDGDQVVEWTVDVPSSDSVCELDDLVRPNDVLAELLGEDADDVLEVLRPRPWTVTLDVTAQVRAHFALEVLPRGMWTRLVEQVDLYGEAIESDLADRGADLLDWFRGRRPWPQLLRLLARLPPESRYMAGLLDDEDLARERLARETDDDEGQQRKRPSLIGESPDRALLRAAVSVLMRVEHAVYAVNAEKGKGGKPPRPLPGPETAEDRLREQIADAEVNEIFDQTVPGWRDVAPSPEHVGTSAASPPSGFAEADSGLWVPAT